MEYNAQTGTDYKPSASGGQKAEKKDVGPGVTEIVDKITAQGDKVHQLQTDKASKVWYHMNYISLLFYYHAFEVKIIFVGTVILLEIVFSPCKVMKHV